MDDLNAIIRLNPSDTIALRERGCVWYEIDEFDKAIADFSAAIRVAPNDVILYNNRSMTWQSMGQYDRAIADMKTAIALEPSDERQSRLNELEKRAVTASFSANWNRDSLPDSELRKANSDEAQELAP
jgi:tetratricopeptide (TPR) repeat protein